MLNSRDVTLLRSDIAANCRTFVMLCARAGFDVLITGTVRDNEYQKWCFDNGYSTATVPSFHGVKAGLAFDICKNKKGEEYSDMNFWRIVGAIGKTMGFTWGGDWTRFTDMPHFQWDNHGTFTGSMIRGGIYPPRMPLYVGEDELDMTIEEAKKQLTAIADTGSGHEAWADKAIKALVDAGVFAGDGSGNYGWGQMVTRETMAVVLYNTLVMLGLLDKLK